MHAGQQGYISSTERCSILTVKTQTMNHIAKSCLLTTVSDDGLLQLHSADDNAAT